MNSSQRITLLSIVAALFFAGHGLAGPTGNVKGKITDVSTGEALPGVNVLIVGSGRGAVTNDKGEYFITGVNPGNYILRVSLLGYQTIESRTFEVKVDETLVLDFRLASTDIEMEGITVVGQPPLVDVTKTAGSQTFDRDKIEQLPNVKGVEDVLGLQAGVVKFGGQLFLRGGRANETQILIDGVVVNDVGAGGSAAGTSSANEQLQQLYSGNSTAGAGGALAVAANAIASVSVSSSGLDAEFGNAQSGVVSITTKSGGEQYSGSVQYRTDGPTEATYNERYYAGNVGGPEPITTYLLPSLGVEVPGKMSFFMSTNFNQSDGPYGFNRSAFYNPLKRKIRAGGFLSDILNFTYTDRQTNAFTFNVKLNYNIGESDQFSYSYRASAGSNQGLSGAYSWRDRADSLSSSVNLATQSVFQWTHILGTNSILRGYVSRLETERTSNVGGLTPADYNFIRSRDRDPSNDGFVDIGMAQSWSTSNSVIWNAKFDYNAQVHRLHFIKTGFEYFYEHNQSTVISFPSIVNDTLTRGAFPGFGDTRWVANNLPSRGAFWLQDNIEFGSINIKVGLRYDWFYLGKQVASLDFVRRWEALVNDNNRGTPYRYADWVDYRGYGYFNPDRLPNDPGPAPFRERSFWKQFSSGNFSPRLAIGYPISIRTVFYFNYGHFLQYPERNELYRDPVLTNLANNSVGNPSLKPQKTVQYEAGFDQLLFEDLSLGIRGFYKDIFDYIAFRPLQQVDLYVNLDYASARGFEIILTKQLRNRYSGSIGYTFQLAKGRSSNPLAAQLSPVLFGLPREVRLDWDQQHTLNMFAGYRVGPREDFTLFGLPFDNWGASVTWNFGSGFPYTPYDPTIRTQSLQGFYLRNSGTGPYTSEFNINLFKGFTLMNKMSLTLTLDITNLFNRRNVDLNAGGFNSLTGRPVIFGDYDPTTRILYSWGPRAGQQSMDSRVPPFIFRGPRQIAFGMRINWD